MVGEDTSLPCSYEATFPCGKFAELLATNLSIDKEVRKDLVTRQVEIVNGGTDVHVVIRAADPRSLRGATNAFLEAMELSLEVCEEFRLHPEEAATK